MSAPPAGAPPQRLLRGLAFSVLSNAIVPVLLYRASIRYFGASEVVALSIAALFPLAWTAVDIVRVGSLDPVAVISIASIAVSMVAVVLGGSPKLLLIRESFFTGAFGIACFASLAFPRPIMFYFARYFTAGRDPARISEFDRGWQRPRFRRTIRLMTTVWGVTSLAEFIIRIVLVYTLSTSTVLVVSPIVLGVLIMGTISWTLAYGRRMRDLAARELPSNGTAAAAVSSR